MSDDQPNNPTTGDRPDGEPAPLGHTEIPEGSPSEEDMALSNQAAKRKAEQEQSDS